MKFFKKIPNMPQKLLTLFKGIYNYNFLHHFKQLAPTELQINVTYWCNSRCQMCNIWKMKPKNELSLSEWKKIMKDPIFLGIKRLMIAGGEPILHPELIKLIKLYLNSMPRLQFLSLVTNGFLPQKTVAVVKTVTDLCKKRGISFSIAVSLDGIGKMHNLIRRIPNAFKKTSTTIMTLKSLQSKHNFGLGASCLICRKNLYHIRKVKAWCKKRNIPINFQLIGFHETYVQNIDQEKSLDFRKKDRKYLYDLLEELANDRSLNDVRSFLRSYFWRDMLNLYKGGVRTTPCPFLYDAFVLDSLGDVYYCLSEKQIGNCRKGKNVSAIYYNHKNLARRRKMSKSVCLRCNSACFVTSAIAKDFKRLLWFYLMGK